jgi:hypothetical protein
VCNNVWPNGKAHHGGCEPQDSWCFGAKGKRRANNIVLIGIGVTFLSAMISLLWNAQIQKQATRTSEVVETTRVESGDVVTNTNDFAHPWVPWIDTVSPVTIHLGVAREVVFSRPFKKPPHITLGLRGLDFPHMPTVLESLGFTPSGVRMLERLNKIHLTADDGNVSVSGFALHVGIGLPTEAAQFLQRRLQSADAVNTDVVADMRTAGMLENHDKMTPNEVWMSNFYTRIGTFQVSWIAQAEEDHTKR